MFWKTEFGRNVGKMMGGTSMVQGLNFLGALVLARLYTESDFGRLALFTSMMMMVTGLAGLRYELAVVLPKQKTAVYPILGLSLLLNTFFAFFSFLLLLFFKDPITEWFEVEELGLLIYGIPLGIFLLSTFNSFNNWFTREKEFGFIVKTQVGQTIVGFLGQLGFYFVFPATGLIIGLLLKMSTGFLLFVKRFSPDFSALAKAINIPTLKSTARKHKEFPLVNAPHVGVDLLQNEGIIFLLVYFFSSALVGSYAFALRIVKAPLGLIGKAVTPVFYQKAAELYPEDPEGLHVLVKDILKRLFYIGLPAFVFLFFLAPDLFALLFGENWREAGYIARILCPWLFLNFLANPIAQIPLVVNKQKTAFGLAVLGLFLKLGALLLAGISGVDGTTAFIYLCVGATIYQAIVLLWYFIISKPNL